MSKRKASLIVIVFVFVIIFLSSTPNLALRTSVFLHGYPIISITTVIQEYEPYSKVDMDLLNKENAKLYKLTPPPIEKATEGYLYTWKVNKLGFLYFASYYGEG